MKKIVKGTFLDEVTKPAKFKPHPHMAYTIHVKGANGEGFLTKNGYLSIGRSKSQVYGYPDEPHQFNHSDLLKEMKTLFERFLPGEVIITIVP